LTIPAQVPAPRPLRVLLIEDSEDDAALILRQLRLGGYAPEPRRVETPEELREALRTQPFEVILCDYSLPRLDAPAAFRILREEQGLDVPFIIVSGTIGEERAVECIRFGARDFILKDRLARLPHAVARELAEAASRTEQARTKEQLARAERALLRSEKLRALGQMAAGIAHDLKNICTPVAFRLQLLTQQLKRESMEEAYANITEMHRTIRTGIQNIDRIRSFSRQSPETPSEIVNLNLIAKEALALARPRITSNRAEPCELHVELGAPPLIRGNPAELTSAVVNLLSNSIDAMPGGGNITVRTREEAGSALLQVTDEGPGLSAEVEKHLFEPFFTTKGEAGTGLGLAMVYGTVMRHAGTISYTTAPGKGATFSLLFPSLQQSPPAP
jgi:signal transduction histidine kinase